MNEYASERIELGSVHFDKILTLFLNGSFVEVEVIAERISVCVRKRVY